MFENLKVINQVADRICELRNEIKDLPVYKNVDVYAMLVTRYWQSWGTHHGYSKKLFFEIVGRRAQAHKQAADKANAKKAATIETAKKKSDRQNGMQLKIHYWS